MSVRDAAKCERCGAIHEAMEVPIGWISIQASGPPGQLPKKEDAVIEAWVVTGEHGATRSVTEFIPGDERRLDFCSIKCLHGWFDDKLGPPLERALKGGGN